jgi:alkylation response protein AidB-like acyl-CoA dehydrogenase
MTYRAPVRDIQFTLEHVAKIAELNALPAFPHADPEMIAGLLSEAGRFCNEVIAPTNADGDAEGSVIRGSDNGVTTPASFKPAYRQYVAAGWGALQFPEEFGGGAFPLTVATAFKEMLTSANMAFSLGPLLTTGAVIDLLAHGDDYLQQTFLPKMISGEWTGTMNLSEPQAGSDVGALTSKAIPQDDGTYLVSGTKIWISYGDHDLTDNIVHLVLARLPDAPVGTKGISLFVVPKVLVNDDGSLGARNNVAVVSTEHKLGIHASPTCVMEYAEAVGYLIGEPNKGMRQMFTMMNDARLGVGVQGIAISERAYQQALQYSLERRQGIAPGDTELVDGQSLIVKHPDVRRQLLTIKSTIEAARALALRNASALDFAEHHPDADRREAERKLADLLTPLTKSWGTDLGVENTSHAIQIYGGMGYVEETGVAQHFRDARIAPIYEGTNGIQAMDLVGRKLPYDGGAFVKGQLGEIGALATSLNDERFGAFGSQLARANDALGEATEWIFANREDFAASFGGATPYLRMFAVVMAGKLLAEGLVSGAAASDVDAEYLNDRFAVARFYADNILTTVHGLLGPATAGAESLFALADDHLASA